MEILRIADVQRRTGLTRSQVYRFIAAGRFPAQVRLSEQGVGWISSEIDEWIQARIAERDAERATEDA